MTRVGVNHPSGCIPADDSSDHPMSPELTIGSATKHSSGSGDRRSTPDFSLRPDAGARSAPARSWFPPAWTALGPLVLLVEPEHPPSLALPRGSDRQAPPSRRSGALTPPDVRVRIRRFAQHPGSRDREWGTSRHVGVQLGVQAPHLTGSSCTTHAP
jgi:hypothetical protein